MIILLGAKPQWEIFPGNRNRVFQVNEFLISWILQDISICIDRIIINGQLKTVVASRYGGRYIWRAGSIFQVTIGGTSGNRQVPALEIKEPVAFKRKFQSALQPDRIDQSRTRFPA